MGRRCSKDDEYKVALEKGEKVCWAAKKRKECCKNMPYYELWQASQKAKQSPSTGAQAGEL